MTQDATTPPFAPQAAPELDWRGATPVSRRHGDPYWSPGDGLAEARHVFLAGNALPDRFAGAESFAIAELGFGAGLNLLAAWTLWRGQAAPGARLRYVSVEAHPLPAAAMARAHAPWPELAEVSAALREGWEAAGEGRAGDVRLALEGLDLEVRIGPAVEGLPPAPFAAQAWFLDGFAPARNPEMWEPRLLAGVFRRTAPGGTFATYTAAGQVRRALADAGFEVGKRPGFGRKRDMTAGRRP